jgi:hypothetical protein
LFLSLAIFLFGLSQIMARVPDSMCLLPYNEENCNDMFLGGCTGAGGCWANGPITGRFCNIYCKSYIYGPNGCELYDHPMVDCGIPIK